MPETVEVLRFPVEALRAKAALDALTRAAPHAGVRLRTTTTYRGGSHVLMLWGPGAPDRFGPMRQQLAAGGHVVALDLAYWQRERKFRVSIDAAHPQAWVMRRDWPASRLAGDGVAVEDAWNPHGPVIVAGIGDKATVQYGGAVRDWEDAQLAHARAAGYAVQYRPKKSPAAAPTGIPLTSTGPIEIVLRGASALVTWHSNVAVDAIRLGIPAVCCDGAAAAVCGDSWSAALRPLALEVRARFLRNLAWFQWDLGEAIGCWTWLREALA